MLTTQFDGGLRSRPLDARPDRDAGAIFFLTDVRGYKDDEIAAHPDVCWIVTVPGDNVYLSITAARLRGQNPERARKIWKNIDSVWWKDGWTIRTAACSHIEPMLAGLWDGPSSRARRGVRIRQGQDHRRKAVRRREPQEDRDDGLTRPARPAAAPLVPALLLPQPPGADAERSERHAAAKISSAENAIGTKTRITTSVRSPTRNIADRKPARMKVPAAR